MGAVLSFGQDPRWRRALVRAIDPKPGERVLDVATGTGMVAVALARHSPCELVALDQSEACWPRPQRTNRERAELAGRITVVRGEAERLPFDDGEFDALTFTYLLRYVDDRARRCASWRVCSSRVAGSGWSSSAFPRRANSRAVARPHARRAALGRPARLAGMAAGRALPGPEHRAVPRAGAGPAGLWGKAGIREVRLPP